MKTTIKEKVYINRQSKEQACNFEISRNTSSVKNVLKANNSDNILAKLMSYNDVMMNWLDEDAANMQLFFENPVAAFKKATNAPDELLEACKNITGNDIAQYLPKSEAATEANDVCMHTASNVGSTLVDYSQGWDFVSGITQKNANEVLRYFFKDKPVKFHRVESFSVLGIVTIKLEIDGVFGIPQLTGGSGSKISIEIPITNGTVTINDATSFSLNGGIFGFTTVLTSIESTFTPEEGGKLYDYYINFTEKDLISEVKLKNLENIPGTSLSNVEGALVKAMNEAFCGMEYKLFSVNLNGLDEKYPYMVPTYIRYAFVESPKNSDCNVIGVLVQTNGNNPEKKIQLHADTVPPNCGASVILSNRLAVDGLLRDMAKSEIGIKDENINVEGLPLVLSAKKAFNYNKKIEGYTPEITMLKLWFADDLLHMEIKVHVEPSAGLHINYSVKATFSHEITTTTDKEGKPIQVITFKKKDYTEDKDVSAEWWVWFIGALSLGIGTIFVAITLGIVDSMSPSLESSAFHDALVKIDWNHMDIASIQYLNISGHIQIGAYITLLSE